MRRLYCALFAAFLFVAGVGGSAVAAGGCGPGGLTALIDDNEAAAKEGCRPQHPEESSSPISQGAMPAGPLTVPNEYRVVPDCGPTRISDTVAGDATNCSYAITACAYRRPPSDEVLYRYEYRRKDQPNAPWQLDHESCGLDKSMPNVPPPPAIPTMGQIQTAFKRLPFCKPTVQVQPAGNLTLVNLPTYYRATWPNDGGLQPGEISKPVQLLSWSVEFKIASRSYNFHYGDGTSSGPVTDAGGTYPDGTIRHTFDRAIAKATVSVDSQLTGKFRVNGGEWIDIATVADLQNEPVTTLVVKEAHARLVSD